MTDKQDAGADNLPALPEMLGAADLAYVLETPPDWDEDYRATWQKLQVADCNRRQWRAYALQLREIAFAALCAQQPAPLQQSRPTVIKLPGYSTLRYEARTTGEPGWLLYGGSNNLIRAMNLAEVELIEAALASRGAAQEKE